MRQVLNKRQLEGANELPVQFGNRQLLVRVAVDPVEGVPVPSRKRQRYSFPQSAQRIISKHPDNGRQIGLRSPAERQYIVHIRSDQLGKLAEAP